MYEELHKIQLEEYKMLAAVHGIDIGKKDANEDPNVPMFGDPDAYEDMSEDERQVLTEKMMGKHRIWSQQAL